MTSARFLMRDEEAYADHDARLSYWEAAAEDGGRVVARIPVVSMRRVESLSLAYREQLGIAEDSGPCAFVGGGFSQFRSTLWAWGKTPDERRDNAVRGLRRALSAARERGERAVGLFFPAEHLAACEGAAGARLQPQAQAEWCTLDLGHATDEVAFLAMQRRSVRRRWRQDLAEGERLGLAWRRETLTAEVAEEAAHLVASVSLRHGLAEPPRLASLRLRAYLDRPGEHFVVRTVAGDRTLAFTICRLYETNYLDAHTIGLDPAWPARRELYHYAGYVAMLDMALEVGARTIAYGTDHVVPKLARGCAAQRVFRVDFDATASEADRTRRPEGGQ